MYDALKKTLLFLAKFNEGELEEITACFRPLTVKKNTVLLAEGEVCPSFYFVYSGCIRTYYITREGDEKTRYIMLPFHIGTALTSFISQSPSFEVIAALADSELLTISHTDFYALKKRMPRWQEFYCTILEMAYTFQNKKIESLVTLTATERYQQLLQQQPQIIQQLPNKIVASYLDIRQETLSRIKGK